MAAETPVDCHRVFRWDSFAAVATQDHCFSQRRARVIDQCADIDDRSVVHLDSAPEHTGCNGSVRTKPHRFGQAKLNHVRREKKNASIIFAEAESDLNRITRPFAGACIDALIVKVPQYVRSQALKLSSLVFGRETVVSLILMQRLVLLDVAAAANDRRSQG